MPCGAGDRREHVLYGHVLPPGLGFLMCRKPSESSGRRFLITMTMCIISFFFLNVQSTEVLRYFWPAGQAAIFAKPLTKLRHSLALLFRSAPVCSSHLVCLSPSLSLSPHLPCTEELRHGQQHRGLRAPHRSDGACGPEGVEPDLSHALRRGDGAGTAHARATRDPLSVKGCSSWSRVDLGPFCGACLLKQMRVSVPIRRSVGHPNSVLLSQCRCYPDACNVDCTTKLPRIKKAYCTLVGLLYGHHPN